MTINSKTPPTDANTTPPIDANTKKLAIGAMGQNISSAQDATAKIQGNTQELGNDTVNVHQEAVAEQVNDMAPKKPPADSSSTGQATVDAFPGGPQR